MPEFFTVAAIVAAALTAAFLAAIPLTLSLRGTLTVAYDGEITISFRVLFINIRLYPFPQFKRKRHRKSMSAREAARIRERARRKAEKKRLRRGALTQKKEQPKKREPKKTDEKFPIKETLTDTVDILAAVTETVAVIVKRFTHHLRIKVARFKVKVATEDAALTAVTYGAASQIINVLLPILSTVKNFKLPKEDQFGIWVDFASTKPDIDIKLSFSLRTWHLADIGIRALAGGIGKYFSRRGSSRSPIPYSAIFKKSLPSISDKVANMAADHLNKENN